MHNQDDILICTCNEIYKSEIVKAIKGKELTTVEQVGEETTAGTVCGMCQDDIQVILDEINGIIQK
ncbi:MAG: (2Fe-2S)-binding protein [Paludibacteraceae bacterium]|nr:(2Fe-2S)-binding protein [Paludibacteraceae bacterium]MBN2787628.1 (2Fe-2S)-binding protein [Paludibacteraceae bacterium]